LRALEHRQHGLARRLAPQRVGARDMAAQRAVRAGIRVVQQRDVIDADLALSGVAQRGQRMGLDQRGELRAVVLGEVGRLVHGSRVAIQAASRWISSIL
jgi:hypothetical protein